MITITKSDYLLGKNCPKSLWLNKFKHDQKSEEEDFDKLKREEGTEIGKMAHNIELFKNGTLIDTLDTQLAINKTKEYLQKHNRLYESAFSFKLNETTNCLVRVDILIKNEDNSVSIYEVKSASGIKDDYLIDLAFQKYVIEKSGLTVKDTFLVYLNKEYEYDGVELDYNKFFKIENVSNDVLVEYIKIHELTNLLSIFLTTKKEPDYNLGSHCDNPRTCAFKSHCWANVGEGHIEHLQRLHFKKREKLYDSKIYEIKDITDDFPLTDSQKIQLYCAKTDKPHFEFDEINNFINSIKYPIFFLDFESLVKGVPFFKSMKPNQFITYQASIHKLGKNNQLYHNEYLHTSKTNPHCSLLYFLKTNISPIGSIVAFNKSFELSRLEDMVKENPEYRQWFNELKERFIDLAYPFQKMHIYFNKMKGSASIKTILPIFAPELSYKKLAIKNGNDSQLNYYKLLFDTSLSTKEKQKIIKNLKKYNTLDTFAMFVIYKKIKSIVNSYKKMNK
jgi:hypothetical protein